MEVDLKPWTFLFLALVACGGEPAGNAMTNAAAPDGPIAKAQALPKCEMPRLDFSVEGLSEKEQLIGDGSLIDERSHDRTVLHVVGANEANIASIYFAPSGAPPATMMEVPFGDPPQIPSAEELHETIYCWKKGATEEEQETTGRCLPD
jgi:hypothetical protein